MFNTSRTLFRVCVCVLESLGQWRSEGRVAVWLHVPIAQSRLAAAAARHGFSFHHARRDVAVLSLWLGPGPDRLPVFATHQIGVAGKKARDTGVCTHR